MWGAYSGPGSVLDGRTLSLTTAGDGRYCLANFKMKKEKSQRSSEYSKAHVPWTRRVS